LPGLGANPSYIHSQGTVALDWRTSSGYSRRGGYYGVTFHDYRDRDDRYGFKQVDYEATQHVPIYRETWALSLHAKMSTTSTTNGQEIPFFMLPSLGGGNDLRGFDSWRFRDRDSLLLQAEWRIMVNRFLDTALFYDTGKVTGRAADLDLHDLKHDYGFGVRFHGPFATPIRVDIARSNEKTALAITSSAAF
jgi:outer membrane translocation and assembly module TamA